MSSLIQGSLKNKSMFFRMEILQFHLRRPCGRVSTTDGLAHADLGGDEELLHGHCVHVREVLRHKLLAVIPVAEAVVLLEVDGELCDHDWVLDVRLHPFQALDALVARVLFSRFTDSPCLTNMESSIHKVVLNNCIQHANIISGEGLSAEVLVVSQGGTVVVPDVVMNDD